MVFGYKVLKEQDEQFGFDSESIVKPIIESYLGIKLIDTDRWDEFDFIDEEKTIYVELKTRRFEKDKYTDTMVGYNKVQLADELIKKDPDVKILFCFKFTDGIYMFDYKPDLVKKHWIRNGVCFSRCIKEVKKHMFIPINLLTRIDTPTETFCFDEMLSELLTIVDKEVLSELLDEVDK